MVLPAFGLVSEILPQHARKPLFGYVTMVYSIMAIVVLGLIVWAHHMFTSGTPPRCVCSSPSLPPSSPFRRESNSSTGCKPPLWGGCITLNSAMLFSCGFIVNFAGGITGVALVCVPFDIHVHDTYFVVAHFHYIVFGGSVFVIFASVYHWYPKFTGRMLNEDLGRLHCALTFIGFNLCFGPQHWLGLNGMPRRVAEYDLQFTLINQISSVGPADGHQHPPIPLERGAERPQRQTGWRQPLECLDAGMAHQFTTGLWRTGPEKPWWKSPTATAFPRSTRLERHQRS